MAVPTGCALLGLARASAPGPRWGWTAAALVGAVVVLRVARSPLIPAVSAVVLPVVFGVDDVVYPLAVLGWCGLLTVTVLLGAEPGAGAPTAPRWARSDLVAFVVAAVAWIVVAGLVELPSLVVAPPLIVAGLEFAVRGATPHRPWWAAALRRGVLATTAGSLVLTLLPAVLHRALAMGEPRRPLGGNGRRGR